jgi:hypothetical protein
MTKNAVPFRFISRCRWWRTKLCRVSWRSETKSYTCLDASVNTMCRYREVKTRTPLIKAARCSSKMKSCSHFVAAKSGRSIFCKTNTDKNRLPRHSARLVISWQTFHRDYFPTKWLFAALLAIYLIKLSIQLMGCGCPIFLASTITRSNPRILLTKFFKGPDVSAAL